MSAAEFGAALLPLARPMSLLPWVTLALLWGVGQAPGGVEGARILLYPYGHCLNSHLLAAERLGQVLADGGHNVDMLVSTAYSGYAHHVTQSTNQQPTKQQQAAVENEVRSTNQQRAAVDQVRSAQKEVKGHAVSKEEADSPKTGCGYGWERAALVRDSSFSCLILSGDQWEAFGGNRNKNEGNMGKIRNESETDPRVNETVDSLKNGEPPKPTAPQNSNTPPPARGGVNLVVFPSPENFVPVCDYDSLDFMLQAPIADRLAAFVDTSVRYCERILSDAELLGRLKGTGYDLLVLEAADPCSRILADYLDLPFVLLVTTGLGHWDSNPRPPSYLPAGIAPFTTNMTFGERVTNLIMKVMYDRGFAAIMRMHVPFEALKSRLGINVTLSIDDSYNRAALKLVNSDFALEYAAPVDPDTILIGGFAVPDPQPLPPDLQDFMDGAAEHGAIVFSFGTLIRQFGHDWTDLFLQALGRVPQRVVWRHNGDVRNTTALPPNVRLLKWLPQASLLAHPHTRLFVSHCGLNALFEAAHFGVPVLAVPLSGDQLNNAAKISEHLRIGIQVDIYSLTAESMYAALQRVLSDHVFADNARRLADLLRDQPMTTTERILFWVEYVLRHEGAKHLRSGGAGMPLYKYFSLDVIGVLLGCALLVVLIMAVCVYELGRLMVLGLRRVLGQKPMLAVLRAKVFL